MPANLWYFVSSGQAAAPADGVIVADVTLAPNAYAGVIGRHTVANDGSYAAYICWLGAGGDAGCSLNVNNQWTALFTVAAGTVPVKDVNTLTLAVVGSEITFAVADTIVGSASDTTVTSGDWGLYAESPKDAAVTLVYDNVYIYQVPATFKLGK